MQSGMRTEVQYDGAPAINAEALLENCLGSMAFALSLLAELELSGSQYVNLISKHANSSNWKATSESAHTLKGAAGIIGAESLRSLATQIEVAVEVGDVERIASLVNTLGEEMERCLAQIPTIRLQARVTGAEGV